MKNETHCLSRGALKVGGFWAVTALIGLAASSQSAVAQATYIYTGNNYTAFSSPYTGSMRVTATLQLNDWLPPNLYCVDIRSLPGFRLTMSDGVQILDPATPTAGTSPIFLPKISTDAKGQIIAPWVVSIVELMPPPTPKNQISAYAETEPRCFINSRFPQAQDGALAAFVAGAKVELAPGSWSYPSASALTGMLQNAILLNQIGTGTSLYDKLTQVEFDITSRNGLACSDLTAFTNQVNAQTGKKISASQANFILQTVAIMQSELNCGG
jgi:hypothetical protein